MIWKVPVAMALSMALLGAAAAADRADSSGASKNCETVRKETLQPKDRSGRTQNAGVPMRAEHPMRVLVPVEPCEPPRNKASKTVK